MVEKCASKLHYCFQPKWNCKLTYVLTERDLSWSERLSWPLLPNNWNDLSLVILWFPWHARPPHTGDWNKPHGFRSINQKALCSLVQEFKPVICSCSLTKPSLDILWRDKIMSMTSKGKLQLYRIKTKQEACPFSSTPTWTFKPSFQHQKKGLCKTYKGSILTYIRIHSNLKLFHIIPVPTAGQDNNINILRLVCL